MNNLKRLQNLTLKIILFLVWFDFMCFAVILAGNIFGWSFFNEKISSTFFTLFSISLGSLIALVGLHVVLTLSIISNSISHLAKDSLPEADSKQSRNQFRNIIIISVVLIVLIVGYQGVVERNVAKHKVKKVEQQIQDLANSQLVGKLISLIDKDETINKLYLLRDEILLSAEEHRSITLLLPRAGEEGQVFYQITPWDFDLKDETPISKSIKRAFIPNKDERKKFKEMINNKTHVVIVNNFAVKSYYPIDQNGQIKLILLLDTSRNIDSEYLMSRGKWGSK
ncbi:MAG: hypothetical protein KC713_07555 [Candidatus Omnitrophica bacterium]|nr:hypothetical protein [Candidatus Omnitrophota bacterium]